MLPRPIEYTNFRCNEFISVKRKYGAPLYLQRGSAGSIGKRKTMPSNVLENKIAIVVGAGQTPGSTMGNGRATAIAFARAGASVVAVDRDMASAGETAGLILAEGGQAMAVQADITSEAAIVAMVRQVMETHGRIDILHNNVGIAGAGGDAPVEDISVEAFDLLANLNLKGMMLTCKHVLPAMRAQRSGCVLNVASTAAYALYPNVAYKATKMGVLGLTQHIAMTYAEHGVRANAILPGLIDTPMAIEARVRLTGKPREQIVAERNAMVPLRGRMGTSWDVAHAAVFLASDQAGFITGVQLPVDGGALARLGP
ncbi:SDR family NAD(P)-dependent oxidoreductase [Bordetella bronchiseptica]|uniref:SDR family NAD(P)-dependent oxidoreductase n=1 Tax=Bordetella bronchiseptica TaxID=518 RepID=UPI00404A43B3